MTKKFQRQVYANRIGYGLLCSFLAALVPAAAQTVIDGVTNTYSTFNLSGSDSLLITNAGAMAVNRVRIGDSAGSGNNTVIIDGEGSWMQTGQGVTVGEGTANNQMIVRGGAYYANTNHSAGWELFDFVGRNAGGISNSLLITGAGTTWIAGNRFYVGYGGGSYNTTTVDDGAYMAVTVNHAGVGLGAGPGNQWIVRNTSTLELAGSLYMGSGTAGAENNSFRVESGSILSNTATANSILFWYGRNNEVVFDGTGTRGHMSGELRMGYAQDTPDLATNNLLAVQNGAKFYAGSNVHIGYQAGSSHNRALVEGAGSLLQVSNQLVVGRSTTSGNELRIADGGQVVLTTTNLVMSESAGGGSNRIVVTGTGSRLEMLNPLTWNRFANNGTHNEVLIEQGGMISNLGARTMFAPSGTAEHNRFVVDGQGSTHWGVSMYMADSGQNNLLLVTNQGLFRVSGTASIGYGSPSQSNLVLVTGAGSELRSGTYRLSYMGSYNETRIEDGGLLNSTEVRMGQGLAGAGHTLTGSWNRAEVTGVGSAWTNTGVFRVGENSSHNSLVVTNSGRVHNTGILYVGEADDASSNTVLVTHNGMLYAGEVSISHAGAHGNVMTLAAGGELYAGNLTVGSNGTLRIRDAQSQAIVDTVTVGDGGLIELDGGTLEPDTSFVVETGGTLAGTGIINNLMGDAVVTIQGTLSPGLSAGTMEVYGNALFDSDAVVIMEIGGDSPGDEHDQIIVGSDLTYGGTLKLRLIEGLNPEDGFSYQLFDVSGDSLGNFASLDDSEAPLDAGLFWSFDPDSGTVGVIPEAATAGTMLLGLALLADLRRRIQRG